MSESLFIPSSPNQAQQVIAQLDALMQREPGMPDNFGSVYPGIPSASMPAFITSRYITAPFDLQRPASQEDAVNPFIDSEGRGDFYSPLAGIALSREFTALHTESLTEVLYRVVREKNRQTNQPELQLTVATTFDTHSLVGHESPENQVNQPLRDAQEFRHKMEQDPFAAQQEVENLLNTPSLNELVLTPEQQRLQDPVRVSYQEADLLIGFIKNLYR